MKKLISIILTLVIFTGISTVNVFAGETAGTQGDENTQERTKYADDKYIDDEYLVAINYCYNYWIMRGDDENKFNPESTLTRAQMAVIMKNIVEKYYSNNFYEKNENVSFSDVTYDEWYYDSVCFLSKRDLIKGDKFNPDIELKWIDAATFIYTIVEGKEYNTEEAWEWINEKYKEPIENNKKNKNISRKDVAQMIYYCVPNDTTSTPEPTSEPTPEPVPEPTSASELFSDNYTTYSDAYKDNNGDVKSLREQIGKTTYCVNQIEDTLVYLNGYHIEIIPDLSISMDFENFTDGNGNEINSNIALMTIDNGTTIYYIESEDTEKLYGTLYKANIDLSEKTITPPEKLVENANSFKIKEDESGRKYCYFVDVSDNQYKLKYFDIDKFDIDKQVEIKSVYNGDGETELVNIDYYNVLYNVIGNDGMRRKYILYYRYDNDTMYLAEMFDDADDGKTTIYDKDHMDEINNMQYMNVDYAGKAFYGIIEKSDGNNQIIKVDAKGIQENPENQGTNFDPYYTTQNKIRHLAIFDSNIYVREKSAGTDTYEQK